MQDRAVVQDLLERLAPKSSDITQERAWRFSKRMATVYQQQMNQFDQDDEARQWRRLYSTDNMPPPDDTRDMAEVAAQMAFYFPTHFFKFQKAATQQLLEFDPRQARLNPYPFSSPSLTLVDIGAGVGAATLAVIDLLATWTEMLALLGHKQLGMSIRVVAVDPDRNKQRPRRDMLTTMSSLVDRHSLCIEQVTDVPALFPEPDCIQQILNQVESGSFVLCCISNFLSSVPFAGQLPSTRAGVGSGSQAIGYSVSRQAVDHAQASMLAGKAVQCAEGSMRLMDSLQSRSKLLLASEVDEQGRVLRSFARAISSPMELLVRRSHVRFCSPAGCYWHSLEGGEQSECAVNYWSLASLAVGSGIVAQSARGI